MFSGQSVRNRGQLNNCISSHERSLAVFVVSGTLKSVKAKNVILEYDDNDTIELENRPIFNKAGIVEAEKSISQLVSVFGR